MGWIQEHGIFNACQAVGGVDPGVGPSRRSGCGGEKSWEGEFMFG